MYSFFRSSLGKRDRPGRAGDPAALPQRVPVAGGGPDGDRLSYRLDVGPEGLQVDAGTGVVSWSAPVAGTHAVRIEAVDTRGGVGEQAYTLTVRAQNRAPVFESATPPAGVVDAAYRYQIPVTDADEDPVEIRLVEGPLGLVVTDGEVRWTPVAAGTYTLNLVAEDALGAETTGTLSVQVAHAFGQGPPQWGTLAASYTVELGKRLRILLPVSASREAPLRFYIQPQPLPAGMALDATTGEWTYRPQESGEHALVLGVSDGRFTVERQVQVTVPVPDPEAPTRFSGRLLDADSLAQGVERPIVGARVSLLGVGMSTQTDASGRFELTDIPQAEAYVLDLDPSQARPAPLGLGYAGFRERLTLYANVHNEETRPFTLPRLAAASRTQVNPQRETRVSNPELGVELHVPAGMALAEDGSLYVGELWISEVPAGLAPAALPEELGFGQLVTIQPVGVRFAEPVPITFANVDGLPAGTMVSIWSVDPERGEFVVVGEGRVSADEQRIETVSGGIRAADWHAPGPQPPQGTEDCEEEEDCPPDEDNPDDCDTTAGSMVCLGNGALSVSFALPEYRSLAASRGLEFVYRSDSAYPRPAVSFRVTPGITRLRQTALEYQVRWAGRREAPIVVTVPEEGSEMLRLGALLDAAELESGSYPYALWLTNIWVGQDDTVSRFSDVRAGRVLVDNARESAFGAGWRLRGLYTLQVYRERLVRAQTPGSGGSGGHHQTAPGRRRDGRTRRRAGDGGHGGCRRHPDAPGRPPGVLPI